MKTIHWIVATAAFVFAEPVQAGINDPEVIIYRFPGVRHETIQSTGSPQQIIATIFLCTNFSGVTETLRFVTRRNDGALTTNLTTNIAHLATVAVGTGANAAYTLQLDLVTGVVQGTTALAATSTNIICTAMTIDPANTKPVGVALRGIRFSPVPGSQE